MQAWNDPAVLDTLDTRKVLLAVTGPTTRPLELALCTSREAALARLGPRTTHESNHANPFLSSSSAPSDGGANPFSAPGGGAGANPFSATNGTPSSSSAGLGPAQSLPAAPSATSGALKKAGYGEEHEEEEEEELSPPEIQLPSMDAGGNLGCSLLQALLAVDTRFAPVV